jgi:hypothetical protein
MSLIPLPSSTVTLSPLDPGAVVGNALWYAVGAAPSALIAQLTTDIPKHIEGIDKKADPFLEQLVSLLHQLGQGWKEEASPDMALLDQIIDQLTIFSSNPDKAQLLYPQIMGAKPVSTNATIQSQEQTEINRKKNEAAQKAQYLLISKVTPLQKALKSYRDPSLQQKNSPQQILALVGDLKVALEEIAHEQRSLLAKVVHIVGSLAMQTIKEQWDKISRSKKENFGTNNHPLMQLLAVLGKYQSETVYLHGDKKKEITKALRKLDTQSPHFQGIYEGLKEKLNVADLNVKEIHKQVTQFIQARLSQFKSLGIYSRALFFIKARKEELIAKELLCYKLERDQNRQKIEKELEEKYRKIDATTGFTNSILGGSSAATQKGEALKTSETALDKEEEQLDATYGKKIEQIREHIFWNQVNEETVSEFFQNQRKDIPDNFFSSEEMDEILWKAIAYQEQKNEWDKLSNALSQEVQKEPKQIIKSFEQAIESLYRLTAIEQGLTEDQKESAIRPVISYVLGWMGYAKEQMMQHEQNTWEKRGIEEAFDEAIKDIKKGDLIEAIKFIENFVRESRYWAEVCKDSRSPLGPLTEALKGFCKIAPPAKTPKYAPEVYKVLEKNQKTVWEDKFLGEANSVEKKQLLENTIALACFEFVAHFLGLNGDKATYYKRLIEAMDKIKSTPNRTAETLQSILKAFLNHKPQEKSVALLERCCVTYGTAAEFHKQLYLELINILICENTNGRSFGAWTAWSLFSSVYDLVELFVPPFAERLFSVIDEVVKSPTGSLNQKHLTPITGVTKALSTYLMAVQSWHSEIQKQPSNLPAGKILSGTKSDDVKLLLDRSDRYDGMTPEQITLKMGYFIVDYIQLPDYTKAIDALAGKVKAWAAATSLQKPYLKHPALIVQWLLASPVRVGLFLMHYIVKVLIASINRMVQQGGKWYLWKTNALGPALDKALDSLLTNPEGGPILDSLLLEQLEDLSKELDKGLSPDNPQAAAGDENNKRVIGEALSRLFEVIEIDQYDSPEAVKRGVGDGTWPEIKRLAYDQLKKLLATVLVSTSKSLLQKEQVDALLFELFRVANEGLRGGKGVVLTQEQRQTLAQAKNKPVADLSEQEIEAEGKRIAIEAVEKLPKVLAEIREKAINPALDKLIDESVQTPSEQLLNYITWIQSRLFSPMTSSGNVRNIIHFLTEKLNLFEGEQADKDEILREIHLVYGQFMQEMVQFQTNLDANPSPSSSELNTLIGEQLVPVLGQLTGAVQSFISSNIKNPLASKQAILALEQLQAQLSMSLAKIEEREKERVIGLDKGAVGVVQSKIIGALAPLKNAVKSGTHGLVQWEINNKVEQLRNISNNKELVKHLILWQMRLCIKV